MSKSGQRKYLALLLSLNRLLETHIEGTVVNSSLKSLIINISKNSTVFNSFFDLLAYKLQDQLYL